MERPSKNIEHAQPYNWAQKMRIPLWAPHMIHRKEIKVGCSHVKQRHMVDKGVVNLGDILNGNNEVKLWETLKEEFELPDCCTSYSKLVQNLDLSKATMHKSNKKMKSYI